MPCSPFVFVHRFFAPFPSPLGVKQNTKFITLYAKWVSSTFFLFFVCVYVCASVCIPVYRNLDCLPLPLGAAITAAASVADTAAINAANVNLMCQLSPSYKAAAAIAQIATTTATSLLFQLLFLRRVFFVVFFSVFFFLLCFFFFCLTDSFLSFSPPSFHVPQLDSVPLLDSTLSEYGLTPTLHPLPLHTCGLRSTEIFHMWRFFDPFPVKKKIIISYINMK